MSTKLKIEINEKTRTALDDVVREKGVSAENFVVSVLEDYLFIRRFRNLRSLLTKETEREFADKDIFEMVS